MSTERRIWVHPIHVAQVTSGGMWTIYCRPCLRYHVSAPGIGIHRGDCTDAYVVAPPGAQRFPYWSSCPECPNPKTPDPYTNYAAMDLESSTDETPALIAHYQCEQGHRWTKTGWADSPGGKIRVRRSLRCALYRHFDIDDVLLYAGMSDSPTERGKQHAGIADWVQFASRMSGVWYDSRAEAEAAERAAIETELPIFNRKHAVGDQRQREADYLARRPAEALLAA